MSIDYEGIDRNAKARRESLHKLDEVLFAQPEMAAALLSVYKWAVQVQKAYSAVDMEGRTLISTPARIALINIGTTIERLDAALKRDGSGITKWVSE